MDRARLRSALRQGLPAPAVAAIRSLRARRARGPLLGEWRPRSMLALAEHPVASASVPAIDFHTHLGRWLTDDGSFMEPDVPGLLELMRGCNVEALVNLDGRWERELEENLDRYDRAYPGRFFTFCQLDWSLIGSRGGPDALARSLERSVGAGARGLKVWKDLGLKVAVRGRRLLPDDERLDPVWGAAGALEVPVLIHVGDPAAFFEPLDNCNERLEQLLRLPRSERPRGGRRELARLFDALESLLERHRATTFVAAHGAHVEDLAHVAGLLQRNPNLFVDVSGRANELGRQPRAARALLDGFDGRILFGTDSFPLSAGAYRLWFRLLETADECFAYSGDDPPREGRWPVSALDLSPPGLQALYRDTALRLLSAGGRAVPEGDSRGGLT